VIITHGRAKRRMIGYGVGVAADMARTRVPELIAEALRPAPGSGTSEAEANRPAPAASTTVDAASTTVDAASSTVETSL
jgi:hypothetical protein